MAGVKRRQVAGAGAGAAPAAATVDDLGPVKVFVENALSMKLRGNGVNYSLIVAQINKRDDLKTLSRLFAALTECSTVIVSQADRFKDLLAALFKFDWMGGRSVTGPYTALLGTLVSSNINFLLPTLQMIAKSLGSVHLSPPPAADEEDCHEAIHEALRMVLALVPSSRDKLFPVLREAFPHRRVDAAALVNYARQILAMAEYLPGLRDKILGLIVERCLEIDVEIKIEESGEALLAVDEGSEALVISEHVYANPEDDPDEMPQAADVQEEQGPELDEMAEKLDRVMLLLFEYLEAQVHLDRDASLRLFEGLALTLERSILTTHRCKYVPFLLFFLARRDPCPPRVALALTRRLTDIALCETKPAVVRQAAVAFAASYLARSRCLSAAEMADALALLVEAAEEYILRSAQDSSHGDHVWTDEGATEAEDSREGDPADESGEGALAEDHGHGRHLVFYSICQAIFYVVAFQHSTVDGEDVLGVRADDGHPSQTRLRERLEHIACCPLRPLDRCLESVRREFLRLAHAHRLIPRMALYTLGYRPRTSSMDETLGATMIRRPTLGHNPLDSYFPFDPYILRRSSRFVATTEVYRYWQALPDLHDEDEEEEEEGVSEDGHSVTSEDPTSHLSEGEEGAMSVGVDEGRRSRKRDRAVSMDFADDGEEGMGAVSEGGEESSEESSEGEGEEDDVEYRRRVRTQSVGSVGSF